VAWLAAMLLRLPFALFTPLTDNYPPLEPELRPYAAAMNAGILVSALLLGLLAGVRSFREHPPIREAGQCDSLWL
jgi:hypothetical protein